MIKLISECNDFLKDCGITYAFCGGYALEMFTGKKVRSHSDVDITVFEDEKKSIVKYILNKGWNVYEHKVEWINNKNPNIHLRPILNTDDEKIPRLFAVWAVKPASSLFGIEPEPGANNMFKCDILNHEQLNFDFIEIIFNKRQNGNFICDKDKGITRELDKAILYDDGIPYLAPEVTLFIISNPAYMKSEYHREKNKIDFDSVSPRLPNKSKEWLINALERAYPEGNPRIDSLKAMYI